MCPLFTKGMLGGAFEDIDFAIEHDGLVLFKGSRGAKVNVVLPRKSRDFRALVCLQKK